MNLAEVRTKAEAGGAVNQCVLGLSYLHGHEVEVDYAEALRWLSAAAKQNVSRAVLNLGLMHARGLGMPQNVAEAIRLLRGVADPDDSSDAFAARIELARLYLRQQNARETREWYSAALSIAHDAASEEVDEATAYLAKGSSGQNG